MKNKSFRLFPSAIAASFILLTPALHATAITWDALGVDTNWSTQENWDPDDADVTGDDVTFNAAGATGSGTTNTVSASATINSLSYNFEDAANQHTTDIAAGLSLTVTGNFSVLTGTAPAAPTKVSFTGATGTLNLAGSTVQLGNTAQTAVGFNSTTSVDMSALGTLTANLTGASSLFRVGGGGGGGNTTSNIVTLKLAADSTITAATVGVSDFSNFNNTQKMLLGSGTNTINTTSFRVGNGTTTGRSSGELSFNSGTGTLFLRGLDGVAAVSTMNMVNSSAGTGNSMNSVVNLASHSVDAKITSLTMAKRTGTGTSASGFVSQSTLTFDLGTFEVAGTTIMGANGNAALIGKIQATVNIGGGTASFGAINMADNSAGDTTKTITANLNLTGGTTTVNGDIVKLGTTNAFATLALSGTSTSLDMTGKNITSLTGITYTDGLLKNLGTVNTGMTLAGTGSRVFDQAAGISGAITGAITGTGVGLTKQGAGTLALAGTNTYDGPTQIDGGILVFRKTAAKAPGLVTAGPAGSIGLGVGGTGTFSDADVAAYFNTNTLTGFTVDAGSSVALDTTAGNFTQATALTAARGLTKLGANTLTLSQPNTYTGVTTASAGTINLGVAENVGVSGPLGSSAAANPGFIVFGGGTLQYSASNTHDYSGRFSTAANQSYSVNTNSQNVTWASDLTSSGGTLTKLGAGTLTLTGDNTFTGNVTISVGEVKITESGSLGIGPKTITVANASSLTLDGTAGNIVLASDLSVRATGIAILNLAGANVINGTVTTVTGNGTATITSDGGSLNLAGNISSAALNNRFLQLSGTSTGANTVSGTISNGTATPLNLTKSGAGTWTITNASNAYTGATNVNDGTLSLGATGTIATSASVTIKAGAILDTSGQASYGIPGTQPLTFGLDPAASGSSGKIAAAALDITSAVVTISPLATLDDPVYVLATYTAGNLTGTAFGSVTGVPLGYELDYDYEGNKIALVPSTSSNFASWAASQLPPVTGGENGDDDNDGVKNLVEYALINGGERGVFSGNTITFTKRGTPYGGDVTYIIETSETLLSNSWTDAVTQSAGDPATTISYTFTPSTPVKKFARLKVITTT